MTSLLKRAGEFGLDKQLFFSNENVKSGASGVHSFLLLLGVWVVFVV